MNQEEMIAAVRDWLDNSNFSYKFDEDSKCITMGFNLENRLKSVRVFVLFRSYHYLVYVVSPISGDPCNLGELMKFLVRANFGFVVGNFELDVSSGEVRYKSYVNCEDLDNLPAGIIKESICIGFQMMNRYGNGIAALAMGLSDADTEIDKAEKN